jgi:S-disulfanyl-L-cysteine oxidoreductase SoxD
MIVLFLILLFAALATAQETPPAQVFTAEQASAGKTAFEKSCAACHMHNLSGDADAPALVGTSFMSTWRTRTTRDLREYMSTSMPPGSAPLGAEVYTSITAYVLKSNGAAAGPNPLTMTTAVPIGTATGKP